MFHARFPSHEGGENHQKEEEEMKTLQPSDFGNDFGNNCETLGRAIGWSIGEMPGFVYEVTAEDGSQLIVPSVPGRKASAALLVHFQQRAEGFAGFTVEEGDRPLVDAFFAPFAEDPPEQHPSVQILQKPGTKRVCCLAQEPGLAENVEDLWLRKEAEGGVSAIRSEGLREGRQVVQLLNYGLIRAVSPSSDAKLAATPEGWTVNEWVRHGILLRMACASMQAERVGGKVVAFDKLGSAFADLTDAELAAGGVRIVRGFEQREGSFCEEGVIGMPGFVNIGAWVGAGTMVDAWATVGSCAQIGKRVHLSGGVGIGGVLEPEGTRPVIICDDAFIGSRCILVEGVFVGPEAVIGAGVTITESTAIIDVSGSELKEYRGYVPARSVVIPGMRPKTFPAGEFMVPCVLIIGERKAGTDKKTSLNNALRDFNVAA